VNRDQIAAAALKLADQGGLDAVTMRDVAKLIGAGAMSLYRHVPNKDGLLDLILDRAFGEMDIPAPGSLSSRRALAQAARSGRRTMLAHPWLSTLTTMRPTLGENYLRWFESMLEITRAPRRSIRTQVRIIGTLWSFVSGFAAYENGERQTGITAAEKRVAAMPRVEQILQSGNYPRLKEFVAAGIGDPTDADFDFGLTAVLDGLGV